MATDGTRAWQLNGRCRGDLHPVHTVRRRVIIMTRAPCRCSASPSFSFRPAALLLHNHHRRSWHDLGTPGDGLRASCWTEAYAYRASLICGPVLLLRACILCGVCVSVVNISLIGVIYGSGGSVHLTLAHRQKLAVAHRSRPRNASSLRRPSLYCVKVCVCVRGGGSLLPLSLGRTRAARRPPRPIRCTAGVGAGVRRPRRAPMRVERSLESCLGLRGASRCTPRRLPPLISHTHTGTASSRSSPETQ